MVKVKPQLYTRLFKELNLFLFFIVIILLTRTTYAQTKENLVKGMVSYISSQNIYVKFESTTGLKNGDSLYISRNNILIPIAKIISISSVSCSGSLIGNNSILISTPLYGKIPKEVTQEPLIQKERKESISVNDHAINQISKPAEKKVIKSDFEGRIALSTYSILSGSTVDQRYRYNLSLNGHHINESKFSLESYISLTHKSNEFHLIGKELNKYLKIYSLALKYELSQNSSLTVGRKINLNMANVGAIDGIHYEINQRNFTYGVVVGSHPDFFDYRLNLNLMQVGIFAVHAIQNEWINMQTSLAFFDQMNKFKTDRRFTYFQHSNTLGKKIDLFCSFEFDFYTLENLKPKNTLELTSTYLSVRYKPWNKFSVYASYDARKNVYYYETFKNQIDSIIDKETRQGFRFQFNYRAAKLLILGGSAGYRFQKSDPAPSINGYSYITYSQLPLILTSISLSNTILKSSYLDGMIYGISLSRDIINGKVFSEFQYRHVNYNYKNSNLTLKQQIVELSFSWRIAKKLTLTADFEATHEADTNYSRIYVSLIHRFGGPSTKLTVRRAQKPLSL